jgi:hypothetical protein
MIVAGRLIQTTPVHRDPDEPEDGFADWMLQQGLSRLDGSWLADRRDRTPLEWSPWKNDQERDDWRWSLWRSDFERVLLPSNGRINLWGRWLVVSGRRTESISIHSALVSRVSSEALLRSLHTSDPYSYYLGSRDDEHEGAGDNFQIKDWVSDHHHEYGLDKLDGWAGEIRYPPIVPADFVVSLMNLTVDSERRNWIIPDRSTDQGALWSELWGHPSDSNDEAEDRESGRRLQASSHFLCDFLYRTGMDLIISVEMERRLSRSRYERSNDDAGYTRPSVRIFLAKSDGTLTTI